MEDFKAALLLCGMDEAQWQLIASMLTMTKTRTMYWESQGVLSFNLVGYVAAADDNLQERCEGIWQLVLMKSKTDQRLPVLHAFSFCAAELCTLSTFGSHQDCQPHPKETLSGAPGGCRYAKADTYNFPSADSEKLRAPNEL